MDDHSPVMLGEVLVYLGLTNAHLNTKPKIIDATLGAGGYTRAFTLKGAKVLGVDADPAMIAIADARLNSSLNIKGSESRPFKLVNGNFSDLTKIAFVEGFSDADAIVFDLGVSTQQLTSPIRGFSFRNEGAILDMRLSSQTQGVTASDLLNALEKDALTKLFLTTCDYKETTRLVKRILETREESPFVTVGDFLQVTRGIFKPRRGINPVTRAFLALRMAVNSELENLAQVLDDAIELLKVGGKLVVVSFHSGEDAIVKAKFRKYEAEGLVKILTKHPVVASETEVGSNPRARSAKLRALVKN